MLLLKVSCRPFTPHARAYSAISVPQTFGPTLQLRRAEEHRGDRREQEARADRVEKLPTFHPKTIPAKPAMRPEAMSEPHASRSVGTPANRAASGLPPVANM